MSFSTSKSAIGLAVLLALAAQGPREASAAGALALGVPTDVSKQGFSYGGSYNLKSITEAEGGAMSACKTNK